MIKWLNSISKAGPVKIQTLDHLEIRSMRITPFQLHHGWFAYCFLCWSRLVQTNATDTCTANKETPPHIDPPPAMQYAPPTFHHHHHLEFPSIQLPHSIITTIIISLTCCPESSRNRNSCSPSAWAWQIKVGEVSLAQNRENKEVVVAFYSDNSAAACF